MNHYKIEIERLRFDWKQFRAYAKELVKHKEDEGYDCQAAWEHVVEMMDAFTEDRNTYLCEKKLEDQDVIAEPGFFSVDENEELNTCLAALGHHLEMDYDTHRDKIPNCALTRICDLEEKLKKEVAARTALYSTAIKQNDDWKADVTRLTEELAKAKQELGKYQSAEAKKKDLVKTIFDGFTKQIKDACEAYQDFP